MIFSLKYLPLRNNYESGYDKLWDNTNQFSKISYRINSYLRIFFSAFISGVPIDQLLRARFSYYLRIAKTPPCIHIEYTNDCNLNCTYCNNPLFSKPREYMRQETLRNIALEFKNINQKRIVVGGGEATIHPDFELYSLELSKHVNYMSLVTNGQWRNKKIAEAIISFFNLVEVSIDAGGKYKYENSRKGAKFELLLNNLQYLKKIKKLRKSKCQIKIRLMVRPSQYKNEKKELKFWGKYCDTIMPQYILRVDRNLNDEDVYFSEHYVHDSYPKCSYPFRSLQIRANGDIPLCMISGSLTNPAKRLILGNINTNSITELWNGKIMNQYRKAHKEKIKSMMPNCKGCRGC